MTSKAAVPIDVLMPVFNAQAYLAEALESIIGQTYIHWNMLIIDDGSTDDSLKIIQHYANKDPRICFRSRENKGLVATLNELTQWSSAPFIARMDGDDISREDRLEKQLTFLNNNTHIDLLGSWVQLFGIKNEVWHFRATDPQIRTVSFFGKCSLLHASLMARREVFDSYPFDPEFTHLEDFDFLTRIISTGQYAMACIREPLYFYRQHGDSVVYSYEQLREEKSKEVFYRFLHDLKVELSEHERQLFSTFTGGRCTSISELSEIGSLLKSLTKLLKVNTPDVDKEFDYRWLLFCKKNLNEEQVYEYFTQFFGSDKYVFLDCKEAYLAKKNIALEYVRP